MLTNPIRTDRTPPVLRNIASQRRTCLRYVSATALTTALVIACPIANCQTARVSSAYCFREAADRYHVSEALLMAIAKTESSFNPRAVNFNSNRSHDIGLMQINSMHLEQLRQYGITERKLYDDPCVNTHIGAWILAQNIAIFGNTWRAVGAYNTGPGGDPDRQRTYVQKVRRNLEVLTAKAR